MTKFIVWKISKEFKVLVIVFMCNLLSVCASGLVAAG